MMYWTWERLLISVCMLMNLVVCVHCKATLCLCLFRRFYVQPLSLRHYCVICITLIPKIIAAVAGFLFNLPVLCARGHTHTAKLLTVGYCLFDSLTGSKPLSLCRLLSPSAHSLLQHSSTSNTLIHTLFRMTTQMHKRDFQPWLAHAHKTRSLTHSGIIVVVKLERRSERDEERGRGTSTGEAEGGERRAIAPAEELYPQAVFKCLPCPWPSHEDKPLFCPL